ncbi:MAG: hypothetical protein J6B68_12950 [Lachnospiraceae bacterium]|nr:hypothetical protein [Lachnospiraceae bacterium]
MENLETVKKTWAEVKETSADMLKGEYLVTGKECFLAGVCLVLLGMVIGLLCAPFTHGFNFTFGSHNGSNNGNHSANNNNGDKDKEKRK